MAKVRYTIQRDMLERSALHILHISFRHHANPKSTVQYVCGRWPPRLCTTTVCLNPRTPLTAYPSQHQWYPCLAAKVYTSSHLIGRTDRPSVSHVQVVSLGFGPELDLDRSVGGEPDGASIETSCQGRIDARRIIVKREVVGAGMSKSSSREV